MREYLVTMTTRVPDGTSEEAVRDIRTREAARSRELAAQRHLVRLWRPPLQPGEWRTLGLFAAGDGVELEVVLASMPLRVWRTDEVTPLSPHPHDPVRQTAKLGTAASQAGGSEFLTTFTVAVPASTASETVDPTTQREADRARELAGQGYLERLWTLPGPDCSMGLWQAPDSVGMNAMLASLPLYAWTSVQITPLTPHPSDPALASA
jgi:muconolactone delta-isomerase